MTRLLFHVLSIAATITAALFSSIVVGQPTLYKTITVKGTVSFEVPSQWKLLSERELSTAATQVASQAAAVGVQMNLALSQRLVYAPISSRVAGNVVVALRSPNLLPFSRTDLPISAQQPLKPVVLQHFQTQSAVFERAISVSGGRTISRLAPHPVLLGSSLGVEYGSLYEQAQGATVTHQIVAFAGGNVLTVTFSYFKSAEAEFAPIYEHLLRSLKPV